MRRALIFWLLLFLAGGCVSKKEADLERQKAFLAGEQQGLQRSATQPEGAVVYFQGPVRNPVIPYKDGMMLSQAIVDAYYTGFMNPVMVRVVRDRQVVVELKGIDLLHHEDAPLQAGDLVQLFQ